MGMSDFVKKHWFGGIDLSDQEEVIAHQEPESEPTPEPEPDEWVWVDGYKGTNSDMTCHGYQYILGKTHEMDEDEIELCISGFHLCKELKYVFLHYPIEDNHRFFHVKALVRMKDLRALYGVTSNDPYESMLQSYYRSFRDNKLVAKKIHFIRELTVDEIFANTDYSDWSEEFKKMALEKGISEAKRFIHERDLIKLGYSAAFANYLIKIDKYDVAYAVGTQEDLSMDMKCAMILRGDK